MFDLDTCIRIVGHVLGLCRRLSRLVASLICYLLDHACVHEISALVTWFQYMSDISSHYGDLDLLYLQPLWRSWSFVYLHHGDTDLCIFYMAMTTYVISCIMHIHVHCTLMYPGLLYVLAFMCKVVLWYYADWVAGLPFGILHHSTSILGSCKPTSVNKCVEVEHLRGSINQGTLMYSQGLSMPREPATNDCKSQGTRNDSRFQSQNKWSEVDGMKSAGRRALRHPPSSNTRYSAKL